MKFLRILFLIAVCGLEFSTWAGKPPTCVVQSGRDDDIFEVNRTAIKDVDDVLDLLGITRPPHNIEFVPTDQLTMLAVMGRPPVGHWHDGSTIVTQAARSMGIMEFVTPGRPTCRSFYSDGITPQVQVDTFKHVGGHNDFSTNCPFTLARQPMDSIADAHALYQIMEDAYLRYDFDEVAQWYQFLQTMALAQDVVFGSFQSPESLKRPEKRVRREPTPHELQYFVGNFPPELPEWKRNIATYYEKIVRPYGSVIPAKIMNEGWATFLERFLTKHLPADPYQSHEYAIESAIVTSSVAFPKMSNPYWLGREGWFNLYEAFKERPEIKALPTILEVDQAFIKYAHGLIRTMGDYDFLRTALNADWVAKHKLFLYRKAEWPEWDQSLPQPQNPKKPQEQKIVVSSEAKDVIEAIAKQIGDKSLSIPIVKVESEIATGRNVVSLIHEVIENIPLEPKSAIKALFVRTQLWGRPVSLRTVAASTWVKTKKAADPVAGWWRPQPDPVTLRPVRIEVDPSGLVTAFSPGANSGDPEVSFPELAEMLQAHVDFFKEDLAVGIHEKLSEAQKKRFAPFASQIMAKTLGPTMQLTSHSPTAATAILRYSDMVSRRLYFAIKRAMSGKSALKKVPGGARIDVLPDIPEFTLDQRVRSILESQGQPRLMLSKVSIGGGGTRPKKGDHFWGDADPPPGSGSGEGDEDAEEGEGEEGDESGDGEGGKGGKEPSEIDVPLSIIGEFLSENIELPNLRPKVGATDVVDTQRDGAQYRSHGELLWNRMMMQAAGLARSSKKRARELEANQEARERAARAAQAQQSPEVSQASVLGGDLDGAVLGAANSTAAPEPVKKRIRMEDRRKILRDGIRLLTPGDFIVPSITELPHPEVNAVVVFWMDMTGSMMGEPVKMAKQFMFNLKALLSSKYKRITYRYVGFADQGKEFKSERDFFKQFLGGGTNYASGINLTRKILEEYEGNSWDRYNFGIGDLEDGNSAQSPGALKDLVAESQYTGVVQTQIGFNMPDAAFMAAIEELKTNDQFFGHSVLAAGENGLEALRKLFKKQ